MALVTHATRRDIVNRIASSSLLSYRARRNVLRLWGMSVGAGTLIAPHGFVIGRNIRIGGACFLNYECFIDALGDVTIGDHVYMGMQTMIVTSAHEVGGPEQRAGRGYGDPVTIGDGAWLGARVVVNPGVTIGEGCVIASGAVVTRDTEPHCLYGGVPAVKIRELEGQPVRAVADDGDLVVG